MGEYDPDTYDQDFTTTPRACKFPFITANGKIHYNCTYDFTLAYPDFSAGRAWCSIETDENHIHLDYDPDLRPYETTAQCADTQNCIFSWKDQATPEEIQLVEDNRGKLNNCRIWIDTNLIS